MYNIHLLNDEELLEYLIDETFELGRNSDPDLYIPDNIEYLGRVGFAADVIEYRDELVKRFRERGTGK